MGSSSHCKAGPGRRRVPSLARQQTDAPDLPRVPQRKTAAAVVAVVIKGRKTSDVNPAQLLSTGGPAAGVAGRQCGRLQHRATARDLSDEGVRCCRGDACPGAEEQASAHHAWHWRQPGRRSLRYAKRSGAGSGQDVRRESLRQDKRR